jgi:hypothetical protein
VISLVDHQRSSVRRFAFFITAGVITVSLLIAALINGWLTPEQFIKREKSLGEAHFFIEIVRRIFDSMTGLQWILLALIGVASLAVLIRSLYGNSKQLLPITITTYLSLVLWVQLGIVPGLANALSHRHYLTPQLEALLLEYPLYTVNLDAYGFSFYERVVRVIEIEADKVVSGTVVAVEDGDLSTIEAKLKEQGQAFSLLPRPDESLPRYHNEVRFLLVR